MAQVGTVEILRARVYTSPEGWDVWVEPGVYPMLFEDGEYFWRMQGSEAGELHEGGFQSLGDGLFGLSRGGWERPEQPAPVEIDSPRFTINELIAIGSVAEEGHEDQRIRITLTERVSG